MEVTRPLHSISMVCDNEFDVVFTKTEGLVIPAGLLDKALALVRQKVVAKYKRKVLQQVLVKHFSFTADEATEMCFEFGLDPRASTALRMASCVCGQPGFTFQVRKLYQDFR